MGVAIESFERREMKFILSDEQYEGILADLLEYMEVDSYSQKTGFYPISNIYYDTPDDYLIRTSIKKPIYKEKLRMRSYGTPKDMNTFVFVEIKKKYNKIVGKRRIMLPLRYAYEYMESGFLPQNVSVNDQIVREIDYFKSRYSLIPKLYLSYNRKALAGIEDPNFRVTFDKDITVRREDVRLEGGSYGRALLPEGMWIMEIKVLNAMPLWCVKILSKHGAYKGSFSKYGTEYLQYVKDSQELALKN